jgi:hypothetical protein
LIGVVQLVRASRPAARLEARATVDEEAERVGGAAAVARVEPAPHGRARERAGADVEHERDERVELVLVQRDRHGLLDGVFARAHVLGEELQGTLLREAREVCDIAAREGAVVDEMADADRRVAGTVVVGLHAQALLGDEALQPVRAHPHGQRCASERRATTSPPHHVAR